MKDKSIYRLYKGNEVIMEGTDREIKERLHINVRLPLSQYAKHGYRLLWEYKVEFAFKADNAYVYDFYEDGELAFTGTQREFQERYHVQLTGTVSSYVKSNALIKGRFKAKRHGVMETEKPKEKRDPVFDRILEHIKVYGNTISIKEPSRYIEKLKEKGYECRYRKVKSKNGIGRKDEPFYVVEVV